MREHAAVLVGHHGDDRSAEREVVRPDQHPQQGSNGVGTDPLVTPFTTEPVAWEGVDRAVRPRAGIGGVAAGREYVEAAQPWRPAEMRAAGEHAFGPVSSDDGVEHRPDA